MYKLIRCDETRDKNETCKWISKQFNDPFDKVMGFVEELSINWPMSVKALDEDGKTIGLLTLSNYSIEEESEQIAIDNPQLLNELNKLKYISFFSFIVAPQYRGSKLNYDMLVSLSSELKKYDFIFVPVQHHLKTHDYWKRWGGIQFYEDDESKFYIIPLNEKVIKVLGKFGIYSE